MGTKSKISVLTVLMITLIILYGFYFYPPKPEILEFSSDQFYSDQALYGRFKTKFKNSTKEEIQNELKSQGFKTTKHSAKFRRGFLPCSENWYVFWEGPEIEGVRSKISFSDAGYTKQCFWNQNAKYKLY